MINYRYRENARQGLNFLKVWNFLIITLGFKEKHK